jgi:CheY-like chemotaxis protein
MGFYESFARLASPPFGSAVADWPREMDRPVDHPPIIVEIGRPALSSQVHTYRVAMIVERDPDLREALSEYLRSQEHHVLALSTTPHPDELRRLRPDLLVLDLLCDGEPLPIETLRQVRQILYNSAIVATSADSYHVHSYSEEITSLVSAVMIKPFDLDCFDSAAGLHPV